MPHPPCVGAEISNTADRLTIAEVASRIDRAVDDKDWVCLRSCFTDMVSVDIGVLTGEQVIEMPADAFVADIAAINPPGKTSYHSHTNALLTLQDEEATLSAHSYGWNHCRALDPPLYEVWGTMDYRFRKTPGGWKATYIRMAKWREAGNPLVSAWRGPETDKGG